MRRAAFLLLAALAAGGCKRAPDAPAPEVGPTPAGPALGAVQRVHVSPDGKRTAAAHRKDDALWVTIDAADFGPFADSDATTTTPFRPAGPTLFRAKVAGGFVVVANGTTHGPFDEVWTPQTRGADWGALVKKADKYHLLVNGTLSAAFDEVAGDHRLEAAPNLHDPSGFDVPLLLGGGRWVAYARRGDGAFVVTGQGEAGPFARVGHQQFKTAPNNPAAALLTRTVCSNGTRFGVGVSLKTDAGAEQQWLLVDGQKHGPFANTFDFHAARDMSLDGSRWAFADEKGIHTHDGTIDKPTPGTAVVSNTGAGLAYTYGAAGAARLVVNGKEFGPFHTVQRPDLSPDGTRWVAGVFRATGEQVILTADGEQATFKGGLLAQPPLFRGAQWVAPGVNPDDTVAFVVEGVRRGPYKTAEVEQPPDRNTMTEWRAHGVRADGMIEVFSRGKPLATVGPFDSIGLLRTAGDHWAALVQKGTARRLAEDGTVSGDLPAFQAINTHHHSENAARIALITTAEGGDLVVLPGRKLGPFAKGAVGFRFSADGAHWGFTAPQADGKVKVVSDTAGEVDGDAAADVTMTPRGAAFVVVAGGRAWVHVGADRHGPFDAAGLCADGDRVHAAVVEGGKVTVRTF
jgi:hypothetical protein